MQTAPLGLFILVLAAALAPASAGPRGDSEPAARAETAAERFRALDALNRADKRRGDRALEAGLAYCLAVGVGDGAQASKLIDDIGYQPLPLHGDLPLDPDRPVPAPEIAQWVRSLPDGGTDSVPADRFRLLSKSATAELFPAVATWMLPSDYALLCEPDRTHPHWTRRPACVVIRVRGTRASIVGGNLLAALSGDTHPTSSTPSKGDDAH